MSIATQIQRLLNAKNAIKSSIINKSVSVGESVMLNSYHTYINQIGSQSNIGPADVLSGKKAFANNGQYFSGTALSIATSANNAVILNGFTAYDSNGQLLTGRAMPTAATAQNNKIINGYTAYTNTGVLMTGNAFASSTNATNATILKGYTAYLNNGTLLVGNALSTTTNATNDKILKGYTAYNSSGELLTGSAFGSATNAVNNTILNGYTAYSNTGELLQGEAFAVATTAEETNLLTGKTAYKNDGTLLNGAMAEYAGVNNTLASGEINMGANGTTVYITIPEEGHYDTTSTLSRSRTSIRGKIMDYGSVVATSQYVVTLGPYNFKPSSFYLILPDGQGRWVGDTCYLTAIRGSFSSTIGGVTNPVGVYVGFAPSTDDVALFSTSTVSNSPNDIFYTSIDGHFTCTTGGSEGAWTYTINVETGLALDNYIYLNDVDYDYIVY